MDSFFSMLLYGLFLSLVIHAVTSDTPANCTFPDVVGKWILYETQRSEDNRIDCSVVGPIIHKTQVELRSPNIVKDEFGNTGKWTMVYNQGFEVMIGQRKYFAFSKYVQVGKNVTSYCGETFLGLSHDVLGHNWACYFARKLRPPPKKQYLLEEPRIGGVFETSEEYVETINKQQTSWKATIYQEHQGLTDKHILNLRGGARSRVLHRPSPIRPSLRVRLRSRMLPPQLDWRNVSGINYVSPVRTQGNCGSCYAFASAALYESRIRILTNNTMTPIISPQDVLSCSSYSQSCDGGFVYLIAGKYGQDFGLLDEDCAPYVGHRDVCSRERSCIRHYTAKYRYIGGYYGGCSEEAMLISLNKWGPIAVGLEVYKDLMHYKSGIYHHTGLQDKYFLHPFEETNHAVLIVGYGSDPESKEKFWIVKNSWGEKWGEDGYFRIRRGTDECGIESMAAEVLPIP